MFFSRLFVSVEFAEFEKAENHKKRSKKNEELVVDPNDADAFLQTFFQKEWWKEKDVNKLPSYAEIIGEDEPEMPDVDSEEVCWLLGLLGLLWR